MQQENVMSDSNGVNAFLDELDDLIDRYRKQWSLNYSELIGALQIKSRDIEDELLDSRAVNEDEDSDDDDDEMPNGWGDGPV